MKFNKWETKGVPLRIEFGPNDLHNDTVTFVRRNRLKSKEQFKFSEACTNARYISDFLDDIQSDMFQIARDKVKSNIVYCNNHESIINALKAKKLTLINWDNENDNNNFENDLKNMCKLNGISSTKILCLPNRDSLKEYGFDTDQQLALFGRSY
jgi:prolyl-tRNA synthetase